MKSASSIIRGSDSFSLVKSFFIFLIPFEQQFKLFIAKAFETIFRIYVKRVDVSFFHSNERKV
ncbi:hypothetical protein HMPREF1552_01323 [Leptotrichia sp. oral taxon 879 str. F0557]|nr:hypothetical protein HMPREF1552_01323 [Leptotrichia sp. oral taxon 879 str. F0557]